MPLRDLALAAITFIICTSKTSADKSTPLCPIGFDLAYTRQKDPICYRLKGPEAFEDAFEDCAGNLYTSQLYHSLNLAKTNLELWSGHKSLYPGGPFVDWSFTESTGNILTSTYDVKYNPALGLDEKLCVVINPVSNFTAARCNEKHHRFCFIKPYPDENDMTNEGCEELAGYFRFWSPRATCLTPVTGIGGGKVRANWKQASDMCLKRGGSLLHRGWRHANNPLLRSNSNYTDPLGIEMTTGDNLRWVDDEDGNDLVPDTEWSFDEEDFPANTSLVALRDNAWHLVNGSYVFMHVICERSIHLRNVSLNVTVDGPQLNLGPVRRFSVAIEMNSYSRLYRSDAVIPSRFTIEINSNDLRIDIQANLDRLVLSVNDSVDENDIRCFTDSIVYYPSVIKKIRLDENENKYILKTITDGNYWCIHVDSKNFRVAESNKVLFIREDNVDNLYAIRIRLKRKYRFENLEKIYRIWERKLKDYIYYRTKYVERFGDPSQTDLYAVEDTLQKFKASTEGTGWKDNEVLFLIKIKRLFLDGKTALLHVQLNPKMKVVPPGMWDDLEVMYMKPAYYCSKANVLPFKRRIALGQSMITAGCRNYTCVGDFNEGVQFVTTYADGCVIRPATAVTTSVRLSPEVTMIMPTVMPEIMPKEEEARRDESLESATTFKGSDETTDATSEDVTTSSTEGTTEYTASESTTDLTPSEVTIVEGWEDSTAVTDPDVTTTEIPPATWRPIPPKPTRPTTAPPSTQKPTTNRPPPPQQLPEEQLQQVMTDLDQLVNNDSIPILVEAVSNAVDQVDGLFELEDDLEIPGQLLHLIDQLAARADLNGSASGSAVANNIAMLMADASPESPVKGLRIASQRIDEAFSEAAFEIISEEVNSTHLTSDESEAVVHLPDSVFNTTRRISFVVFRNDRAFSSSHGLYSVNSRVLSIKIEDLTQFADGEVIDIHLRPISGEPDRNQTRTCAFWHFLDDDSGYWSTEGCTFIPAASSGLLDTCRCDHLTHFAEILVPRSVFSERNENALEIITIIGCCVSIIGLLLVGLTAIMFRSWRRDFSNKIWLQLCIAIFILVVCFLAIVYAHFDKYDISCMLVGVLLHYSVLASFCWMLVAAVLSYRRLVLVFTRDASHKLLRASAFSWGAPCAVVGILLSVDPHSYSGQFEEKAPSGSFCYPSGLSLWLTVYAPIAIMLLANWTLFVLIVRSVFASRRIQRHGDSNEALRCASVSCLLVFLFGLPWIFGLFAYNIVAAYIFTLTATFQGFVLFVFFVLGNKKTRDLWLNKLKIKQTRKIPVTSSTYTNNKSQNSSDWRGGRAGPAAIEANASKPRSLASPDDARFS